MKKSMNKKGDLFKRKIFSKKEINYCERKYKPLSYYAKRYAAKEACSKALGTGLRSGVFWRDMGVFNLPSGKPAIKLTGGALSRLQEMIPEGMDAQIDLTITDEEQLAYATVIISANNPHEHLT